MGVFDVGSSTVTEGTLAELLAERDIRNQIHNFSRAQDRCDVELFLSVCHPDCVIDYGGRGGPDKSSPRETIEMFNDGHSAFASHLHFVSNITIKVVGDLAVSETYIQAILRTEDADGTSRNLHPRGRYLDRWSKRDGRWAMDSRLLINELSWWDDAVDATRGSQGGVPSRDTNDPAYAHFASLASPSS